MYLAKVIGKTVSVLKHPAYENRTLLLVQPLSLRSQVVRTPTIAVDYVGAGEGDTVIVGAGPGVAQEVFGIENAPIRELIMGIVDHFDVTLPEETNDT
ncbi:ethanolamine utilization protein EutN [Candidatus Poribacteria bacterium]|nr:MAG: ethanolamine utilization protein EutN [Candidatus Poribacteria bacterium]